MKKILILLMVVITWTANGQETASKKKIEVKGSAEKEIIPDEIYLRITLKEYKDGGKKIAMNRLEERLVKAAQQLGLPKENVKVDNIYGYNWNWRKRKSEEYLATKSFQLKVSDVKSINDLIDKLDPKGVNNINVAKVTHSKLEELRYELKAEALKAAKDKAKYLLDALDEKLGGALEVQEIDYGYQQPVYARSASFDDFEAKAGSNYQSQLEFKTITIKSEFRVVFEIE